MTESRVKTFFLPFGKILLILKLTLKKSFYKLGGMFTLNKKYTVKIQHVHV